MDSQWYEVWADDGLNVPYLLIVQPDPARDGSVVIIDPQELGQVIYTASNYEDAELWLLEDEYTRVDGRMMA